MEKERIALIISPSVFLASERVLVSLGLLRIAAVLESKDHSVEVLDLNSVTNYREIAANYCTTTEATVFALSLTTPQVPTAEVIITTIRQVRPDARIIAGGPHITGVVAAYKREKRLGQEGRAHRAFHRLIELFDTVVSGDGERAVFFAIRQDAPKVIDADDLDSDLFLQASDLAQYPFPARHLISLSDYKYYIDSVPATSLIMQLGCCFGCTFCGLRLSPSFRKVRIRPIDNVLAEIREIYEVHGFRGLNMLDDELNVNPRFLQDLGKLAKLQNELKTEFRCRGFLKAELFTEEMGRAMYDVGFRNVLIGFETAHPRILRNIKKRATLDDNNRAMEIAAKCGLLVKALMTCGHAGEDCSTIEATHDWLLQVHPHDFDICNITVYPSTPYYDLAVPHPADKNVWVYTAENGDRLYSLEVDFSKEAAFYKGRLLEYKSYCWTDFITAEEIVKMRNWVERDVREKLGIPFYPSISANVYEHSMGQGFPTSILRRSDNPQ